MCCIVAPGPGSVWASPPDALGVGILDQVVAALGGCELSTAMQGVVHTCT